MNRVISVSVLLAALAAGVRAAEPSTIPAAKGEKGAVLSTTGVAPQESLPRLDAPVTPENSVLFDFGYGKILRVPKILLPASVIPRDPKQPIRADAISMTFWYPDMTPTSWVPLADIIFEKKRGVYVSQRDRFRVYVVWMFYSPGNLRNLPPGKGVLMEPGPEQIERNLACCDGHGGRIIMRRIPSGLNGIDAETSESWAKAHPESLSHDPKRGGRYIAQPGAPYELSMNCDNQEKGVECVAHVYSKKYQFQYRMVFAPEAVAHTDELIRAINRMIGRWTLN